MSEARNDFKHIAVLAFPVATHGPPLLSLVRRLSASASASYAKFSFFSTKESNSKLFSKEDGLENIKPYNVNDGLPENYNFAGNLDEVMDYFFKATPGNFKQAMEVAVREVGKDFTCIVSDAFLWFAADLAQELHITWVPLWTSSSRSLLLVLETDLVHQKTRSIVNEPEDRTIDILPGFSELRISDIPKELFPDVKESQFSAMLRKMGLALPRAAAVASNSFEELDPDAVNLFKSRLPKFLHIGPFVLTSPDPFMSDPHGCLEWLDKQKQESVVYISFGSVITLPPQELAELVEALKECQLPFLWSFRGDPKEELPEEFLERTKEKGKVVSWTPQLKVLRHKAIGVFVTHCGWNSVLDSIAGCVPMICRPFFGDQTVNTRTIEAVWGTGIEIEGGRITKGGLMKALSLVMSSTDEVNKMRKKLQHLQGLALDAVRSSGSSTKNFETLVEVVAKSCEMINSKNLCF